MALVLGANRGTSSRNNAPYARQLPFVVSSYGFILLRGGVMNGAARGLESFQILGAG